MNPIISYFDSNFVVTISLYCFLLVGVVVITTLLSKLCVILKEKAHLSDGVVAGLLLGVITSLPELVTCIASILVHQTGSMGFGDILGSNIFDLFVLGVCLLSCVWIFIGSKANQINAKTLICTGVGTIFALLAIVATKFIPQLIWHGFNFFSILILFSYGMSIYFMTRNAKVKTNKKEGMTEIRQAKKSKLFQLPLKWIIVLIVCVSIVLIALSVFLTFTSESLIFHHWSNVFGSENKATFGGALLLGVITSLPEIICCINLCMHKEYNMVIDTMVGSTSFNLAILSIANLAFIGVYKPGSEMYQWNDQSIIQIIICLAIILVLMAYLVANSKKIKSRLTNKQSLAINITSLSLIVVIYIIFIILGFIK
ncbi:MAG: sodium:calcium antiporter [Mycoplasmoidaceae bacterium]